MSKRKRDHGSRLTPVYAGLAIISLCTAAVAMFFDCYGWLTTGTWKSLSVMDGIERWEMAVGSERDFFRFRDWVSHWQGLPETLEYFPLSGVFAIICLAFLIMANTD